MRGALLVVLVAGCSSTPTCLLPDVISEQVGNQELHDCGTSSVTGLDGNRAAVRACVLADHAAMTPFRGVHLLVDEPESSEQAGLAYLGFTEGGTWKELMIETHFEQQNDGNSVADTYECTTGLSEITPCDDVTMQMNLCLHCDSAVVAAACR